MKTSAVIVSWNACADLYQAMRSARLAGCAEVIVVDNGSTDGSLELAEQHADRVIVLENPGFGAANNAGVGVAQGEYVLLLNSDATIDRYSLLRLQEGLTRRPRVAVLGPRVVFPGGKYQRSVGRSPTLVSEAFNRLLIHRVFPYHTYWFGGPRSYRNVGYVSGCCMLVRKTAFMAVGGFDERFFMYFEDIDLCTVFRSQGWRVGYEPTATAVHRGGASAQSVAADMLVASNQSSLQYFAKHGPARSVFYLQLISVVELAVRLTIWLLLGVLSDRRRPLARERSLAYRRIGLGLIRSLGAPATFERIGYDDIDE